MACTTKYNIFPLWIKSIYRYIVVMQGNKFDSDMPIK